MQEVSQPLLSRRETVLGGALVLLFAQAGHSACGQGRMRHNPIYGCTLPRSEAQGFFGIATESRLYVSGDEPIIEKSPDRDFDFALAHTLARISDLFDVLPGFAYYDDGDHHNAYATREVKSHGPDGTVLFGLNLRSHILAELGDADVAVACICAHEFGHILQYKRGLYEKVRAGQPTVKRVELQADFFAGYFAGIRKLERPSFPAAVFALTQYNMGDEWVHEKQHHGTPKERGDAIVRGFEVAYRERRSLPDAIAIGTDYVMAL